MFEWKQVIFRPKFSPNPTPAQAVCSAYHGLQKELQVFDRPVQTLNQVSIYRYSYFTILLYKIL